MVPEEESPMDGGRKTDGTTREAEEMKCFSIPGPTVTFRNLTYRIRESAGPFQRKPTEREILKNVSGIMMPGMNAIMGPTGSGKTSLLDVIAGRKDPKGLRSGQVMVENAVVTSDLRLSSAYVVQDDILMGTLTVRENLAFSANLRLSQRQYSHMDKAAKVNQVIQELGLQDCADTKIGTVFLRGVSGGEKKRCGIGMELITSPALLFLDEPTTGLDANTANSIIALLQKLSRDGKTVIFSIHQPRYSIFRQFDHLTLLNQGEAIYAGEASKAVAYFEDLGYKCEQFNNPADFFMDITQGAIGPATDGPSLATLTRTAEDKNPLALQYRRSQLYGRTMEQLEQLEKNPVNRHDKARREKPCYATPFCYQLLLVSKRTAKNILRNPQTSYAQLALNIVFGILVGLIYYRIPRTLPEALQNRIGAFFFLVINMVFGNLSGVELFISERALFIHENSGGYYRTSVYFLSKMVVDLIPNRIMPVFVFSAIPYFMMGFKPEPEAFFLFCVTMSLISLSAVSLAFLVSASVGSFGVANTLIALPYVFMMVFGGFLVNLNSMLSWLSWLKWVSIFYYGLNALTINELTGQVFTSNYSSITGEMYMDQQAIDYTTWGFWQNEVALFGIMCLCMLFSYIQLWRIKRWK
ncbi:broad substrate specificity ATP-binding cassette transporter ABCG2c [Scleropages formosus]|uniref:ATP-binding cassette, sub-family G (WHITE), member 2c n=1 Tax=Scleropages formosus TaxID=113540 RepID=A0A8C9T210_SCLFO|nr:ATP-binding cassette sub-family G member 2-like [Scleropages formosus]XP_029109855.1 ATP-binding cassette sub-family G member 2-like [Scleropages formosus]XP_029109856.1 ATP-binding cassette sub-family G member 2-like [Scleropages formosus]XP_029109857.1 ATP-binding cassette sub-family G member 2-like [Scleropages formosus]XP_029109858.1 ATP-binding cassette sub-family G member 2-like [Scleropages formosus]XP_029109859.1 ATP-binding cassette sub-family G member 2-like [Scleropages formosus]